LSQGVWAVAKEAIQQKKAAMQTKRSISGRRLVGSGTNQLAVAWQVVDQPFHKLLSTFINHYRFVD